MVHSVGRNLPPTRLMTGSTNQHTLIHWWSPVPLCMYGTHSSTVRVHHSLGEIISSPSPSFRDVTLSFHFLANQTSGKAVAGRNATYVGSGAWRDRKIITVCTINQTKKSIAGPLRRPILRQWPYRDSEPGANAFGLSLILIGSAYLDRTSASNFKSPPAKLYIHANRGVGLQKKRSLSCVAACLRDPETQKLG